MKLCFDSIEETKEFVKQLKGTRGGKAGEADDAGTAATNNAPPPLQPPAGPFNPGGAAPFNGPAPGGFPQGGFPGAGVTIDPNVMALANRIAAKVDSAIASGQPADAALQWFRSQCGPEAAGATLDQIKQGFLPRLPVATLEGIAKLMAA